MPILHGNRIFLREVSILDVNQEYYVWMNDKEVTRYLESRYKPYSMNSLKEYVTSVEKDSSQIFFAIILKLTNKHIGNIKIASINWFDRYADIGVMIGDKTCWGKGYATEAIKLVCDFAFKTVNLHKLTAGIYEPNIGSKKAFENAGFAVEGVKKSHHYVEGKYVDAILLGLVNPSASKE